MRFERLRDEVDRAERRVEVRLLRVKTNWRVMATTWREAWTPGRLLVLGLAGGVLIALVRPLGRRGRAGRANGGLPLARWVQLATSLSGLVTALRARHAAESAQDAAGDAGQAGGAADGASGAPPAAAAGPVHRASQAAEQAPQTVSDARRRPEPPWVGEPRAAEAATEMSER